ncbi:MAG TPA: thiamine pyrophosphate-binding protein [Syntrophorhabdaceae bacterium]|nr:thiamine pyrophosphate-binding protein [Syntrophorhabdaceae bacterium]
MMKVSDYIAKYLAGYGVRHVFMLTGGGAMHLNDSFGKEPGIQCIFNHHEQACAIAAEGYARVTGKLAVVNVTTGPGGLNTLTGVMGQWTDSVPVLYISGQVRYDTTVYSCREIGLRQLGDQEICIVDIVKPITKFAYVVTDPLKIKYYLDKAIYIATHGRPGPVWLDIPMNIQGAIVDEDKLIEYNEKEDIGELLLDDVEIKVNETLELLKKSVRPVIIAGHGIRIAKAEHLLTRIIEKIKIPVLSTFNGFDLIDNDNPYYIGRIGTIGDRAGNFALQNSDFVLCIGTRNNIRQISYNWETFARKAKKIVIDIDKAELKKPTIKIDLPINVNAKDFLLKLDEQIEKTSIPDYSKWLVWCLERKIRYPVVINEYLNDSIGVHPYYFVQQLTKNMYNEDVLIAGNGSACVILFQAGIVKKGQRIFWNSGCASMGYDLPAAIGACFGNNKKNTICLAGDGSLQLNIQELITVVYHKLPLKIFYLNNGGYISIKQTQSNFFKGNFVGCDEQSGVGFPDIIKIAKAYGLVVKVIKDHKNIDKKIKSILDNDKPVLCEVKLTNDYIFAPKLSSERKPNGKIVSKPLEDMFPFLDRDEFRSNMIVEPIEE